MVQDEAELDTTGDLRLEGKVIDTQGRPVIGAKVWLDSEAHALTSADGSFVFANRAAGLYRLSARKDDLCNDVTLVTLHAQRAPAVLVAAPGITLRVRVTDGLAPIAGAQLLAHKEEVVTTDQEGVAMIRGVGAQFQMFEVRATGYAPTFLSMWLAPDPGGAIERTVVLERGAPLGGVVLDPDGGPASGAIVRIWSGGSWGGDTTTDGSGAWRVDALAAGTYEVRASSAVYASMPDVVLELDGATPRTDVVVRVQRGACIRGRVVSAQGEPVTRPVILAMKVGTDHPDQSALRVTERA